MFKNGQWNGRCAYPYTKDISRRHIRRIPMLYIQRRTALVEAIRKRLNGKLKVIGVEAGTHLVVLPSPGVSDVAISRRAAVTGISAMPLSSCYAKPPLVCGLILVMRHGCVADSSWGTQTRYVLLRTNKKRDPETVVKGSPLDIYLRQSPSVWPDKRAPTGIQRKKRTS